MKRILLSLTMVGTLGFLSCSKPVPHPAPSPQLSPTSTASISSAALTPTETPEPRQYVIEDLKGSVLIFEEGSTQGEKAEEEAVVESGDEIITKANSDLTLTLGTDTMVRVPANSDVKVDQLMPNRSNGFISRLKLVEGKVLCEVESLQESQSSFEISAGGVVCGVRGTAFEVQKLGQSVHTNTFHGIVEMKKGSQIHRVSANEHLAFSLKNGAFIPLRTLQKDEKVPYQNWLKKQQIVRQKQSRRMAVLHSIANLPPEEQAQVLRDVSKVKPKDRVKKMRQLLQKTYVPEPQTPLKPQGLRQSQDNLSRQHKKEENRLNRVSTESRRNLGKNEKAYQNKKKGHGSQLGIRHNQPSKKLGQQGRTQTLSPSSHPKTGLVKPQKSQSRVKTHPIAKQSLKNPQASYQKRSAVPQPTQKDKLKPQTAKKPAGKKGKSPNSKENKKAPNK